MIRLLICLCCLPVAITTLSNTIVVKNTTELQQASAGAKPGDIIVLQNGTWNNIVMALTCSGTKEKPITFRAQTAGNVFISGKSSLKLGGNYIVVEGLYFTNGYAGTDAVFDFKTVRDKLANNCRITNCVINDFNNPRRMEENYWVSFSGKNNRVDHCSFINKKNMGVLMAVVLDDDRSRDNFHSVDHNYFGVRLPLASNGGEIIRIGIAQHSLFNSNTQVTDNFFEYCDGETEIISVKSTGNVVRNNLFKECQGGVVLRHGDNNTVTNNIFLGNGKEGTGGVRIINKGQWVVNNLFYECRGVDFRSPLSIMNGVPNSPLFRYIGVTDAVIVNNTFVNCTPASFCEGSDTERTVTPSRVFFENNNFYNERDKLIYNKYDDISGIHFTGNITSQQITQPLAGGFRQGVFTIKKAGNMAFPQAAGVTNALPDSLQREAQKRLGHTLSKEPGFSDMALIGKIKNNAYNACGASFGKYVPARTKTMVVNCKDAAELIQQLTKERNAPVIINLTGSQYAFSTPATVNADITITSAQKEMTWLSAPGSASLPFLLQIKGGHTLSIRNLHLNLAPLQAAVLITTDTSGSSGHSNFMLQESSIRNMKGTFFTAAKSSLCDSIVVKGVLFQGNEGTLFDIANEKDAKGYYNVEKLSITAGSIVNHEGAILNILRGGSDESTMGPLVVVSDNTITDCAAKGALIALYGAQKTFIESNRFTNANEGQTLIRYEDIVRAVHLVRNNRLLHSGNIAANKFVVQ